MADGDVALHGEGRDGQDGGVCRCFREKTSNDAEGLAEDVGVVHPNRVHLLGQSGYLETLDIKINKRGHR